MAYEDDLLELEAKVIAAAAGGWIDAIDEIRELVALESPDIRRKLLALVAPKVERTLLAGLANALGLGFTSALEDLGITPKKAKLVKPSVPPRAVLAAVAGLDLDARRALTNAKKLLAAGAEIEAVVAPLYASSTKIQRSATWAINTTANDTVTKVAVSEKRPVVWESERDGCVHCLRYAGLVSKDGTFPPGLTYGKKALKRTGPTTTPLHPECRCRLRVLMDQSYADTLRREADRSVLRGFSLPSESGKARLDAAQRLIADGVDAPKSVIAYAEKAIKNGKFPDRTPPVPTAKR